MKGYWIVKVNVLDIEKQKDYVKTSGKGIYYVLWKNN